MDAAGRRRAEHKAMMHIPGFFEKLMEASTCPSVKTRLLALTLMSEMAKCDEVAAEMKRRGAQW